MEIFDILGTSSHPREPIGVKFRVAKRTYVPLSQTKFHVNRCNESPLRGENAHFWPVSKFNTGSLPLRGILPVTRNSAIADKPRDAFRGQSRSPNMVPFHMLGMVSYQCAIVTLSASLRFFEIFDFPIDVL